MFRKSMIAVAMAATFAAGAAQAWPDRPIKLIVPWPPTNDTSTIIGSAMAPELSKELGVPVKVVNQPGGAGVLGTAQLAHARPDGYEVGLISIGPMLSQVLRGKTPYKISDFKPLGLLWANAFALAARADAPYDNLKELAAYGQKHELKLGDWGLGAVPTLIAMEAAQKGNFKWQATSYRNLTALTLMQGDADVVTLSAPALKDYIASGKVKLLAAMLPNRLPDYPKVPTVAEQGFGQGFSVWFGAFVPKDTPDPIVQKLSAAIMKAMKSPKVQLTMQRAGGIPILSGPEDAAKTIEAQEAVFGKLMKQLGIIK
jgi:tripartite-type tricarboxylate transporter receptor subunit TctC